MLLLKIILKVLDNINTTQSKRNSKLLKELIVTQINDFDWHGTIGDELVCEFNYLKDNQGYWVNNIYTKDTYRDNGHGFGTKMIEEAVKVYDKVLVCSLSRLDFNTKKYKVKNYSVLTNRTDTRYPKDEGLIKFANKCVKRNVIKQEWIRSPFD